MVRNRDLPPLPVRPPKAIKELRAQRGKESEGRGERIDRYLKTVHGDKPESGDTPVSEVKQSGMPRPYLDAGLNDLHFEINTQMASGVNHCYRWTVHATHNAELLGVPPTGKELRFSGFTIVKMEDAESDRIAEDYTYWDLPGLLRQLGALP